jgi:hypothetical protein
VIEVKNILHSLAVDHYNRIIRSAIKRTTRDRKHYVDDRLTNKIISDNKKINRFLRTLKDDILINDANTGENIITAKPENLHKYVTKYNQGFGESFLTSKSTKDILEHILYYESYEHWNADLFAAKLNIDTCLYCNRQYIQSFNKSGKRKRTLEFDHFYCRNQFPYLALSFYNLIPSCHTCNSTFKGKKVFTINSNLHPYREGFSNEVKFSILPKKIGFINGISSDYELKFIFKNEKSAFSKRAKKNIQIFHLRNLYKEHKDVIDEIIMKSQIYNKAYISALYGSYAGTLFSSPADAVRLVTSNYTDIDNLHKRPLAKLTRDISKELKLI